MINLPVLKHVLIPNESVAPVGSIAYGLRVQSELALPELSPSASTAADVLVRLAPIAWRPPAGDHAEGYVCGNMHAAYIYVDEVGAFAVRAGREIIIDRAPGATDAQLRVFLLGGALGLLLHQRGRLVLHASAINVDSGAVAFLGNSGQGKSTTAAALHARGHTMLADDMIALEIGAHAPLMAPGFPRLKIWPEVADTLGLRLADLHEFNPEDQRRDWRSTAAHATAPLPLRRIYVLETADVGDEPSIERLGAQDAFAMLIQFSYAVGLLGTTAATPAHFQHCVQLAGSVPIYRLWRERRLSDLPRIAALIDEHLGTEEA
jgi:hypothetical protein